MSKIEISNIDIINKIFSFPNTTVVINKIVSPIKIFIYILGKPITYKTKKKLKYINAVPGSGWIITRKIGIKTIKKLYNWILFLFKSECILLKYFAKAKPVIGFINSEGWRLKPIKENQDFAPLTSFPKISTAINKIIPSR